MGTGDNEYKELVEKYPEKEREEGIRISKEFTSIDKDLLNSKVKEKGEEKIKEDKSLSISDSDNSSVSSIEKESKVFERNPANIQLVVDHPASCFYEFFIKSHRMICHFSFTIIIGCLFFAILFILGIILGVKSKDLTSVTVPYSDICANQFGMICNIPLQINRDLDFDKIFIYLKISNLPQTIKEFTEGYSIDQLRGLNPTNKELFYSCGSGGKINELSSVANKFNIDSMSFDNPCGYLPKLFPLDKLLTLENYYDKNFFVSINDDDITSKWTRSYLKNESGGNIDTTSPQFANWLVS